MANDLVKSRVTSTVHQARLQMFQATRRPIEREVKIETSWGTAEIKGRLGQGHADLIEAILFESTKKTIKGGRLMVLADPYQVKKRANQMSGSFFGNFESKKNTLRDIVGDLKRTTIITQFKSADGRVLTTSMGSILDEIVLIDEKPLPMSHALRGRQTRSSVAFIFGRSFTKLLEEDLQLNYSPDVVASRSGVVQAVCRFVLGHKNVPNGGWLLETLLDKVGIGQGKERRNRRSDMRQHADDFLKTGFKLVDDRLIACSDEPATTISAKDENGVTSISAEK